MPDDHRISAALTDAGQPAILDAVALIKSKLLLLNLMPEHQATH
jgi:hypothetical protein